MDMRGAMRLACTSLAKQRSSLQQNSPRTADSPVATDSPRETQRANQAQLNRRARHNCTPIISTNRNSTRACRGLRSATQRPAGLTIWWTIMAAMWAGHAPGPRTWPTHLAHRNWPAQRTSSTVHNIPDNTNKASGSRRMHGGKTQPKTVPTQPPSQQPLSTGLLMQRQTPIRHTQSVFGDKPACPIHPQGHPQPAASTRHVEGHTHTAAHRRNSCQWQHGRTHTGVAILARSGPKHREGISPQLWSGP
jgi:hypothetical protein